jgi:hypothetical protein
LFARKVYTVKIIVSTDACGAVMATKEQGAVLAECFFKTDEETGEEIQAWGYRFLLQAYPTAQIEAGTGIDPQEIEALFIER